MMDEFNIEDYEITQEEWESKLTELAPRIGWLVISFNSLENKINEILVDSLSGCEFEDEKAYIFIAEMNYSGKVNALNKYLRYLIRINYNDKPEFVEKLRNICTNLTEAGKIRNQYVHANWDEINKKNIVFIKMKVEKHGLTNIQKTIKPDDIVKDQNYIDSIYNELEDFYDYFC